MHELRTTLPKAGCPHDQNLWADPTDMVMEPADDKCRTEPSAFDALAKG